MSLRFTPKDLGPFNTLALPARAPLAVLTDEADVPALCEVAQARQGAEAGLFVLGGGSNVVLPPHPAHRVVRVALRGIRLVDETPTGWVVEAAAGENWHGFVRYCVQQGWPGLENLALIPGTVGAAPVQNIGAYGLELAQRLHSLVAWDLQAGRRCEFASADCGFAYRDSRFKRAGPGRWLITRVRFALPRAWAPCLGYPDLQACFGPSRAPDRALSAGAILDAVCAIRRRKLPDPAVLPNAGSFFKNPVVDRSQAAALKRSHPALKGYPQDQGVKLAAGWLIEQAGWKGRRLGPVGMHARQALVLVNHGGAQVQDVLALQKAVQDAVYARFGVRLEREPVLLD